MISKILSIDWALWFFWIMATTLGWFFGGLFPSGMPLEISGFLIAVFQWLVLLGRIAHPWRWVVFTFLGWTVGYLIVFFETPPELEMFNGMVIGLTVGMAQWMVLRSELRWAGWWIIFCIIGWITGLTLTPGVMLTGTMAGTLTGLALEILLRHPKLPTAHPRMIDTARPDR